MIRYVLILLVGLRAFAVDSEVLSKKAVVFGIAGQDGYYLAKLLLSKGYEVHGSMRGDDQELRASLCSSNPDCSLKLIIHRGDLADSAYIKELMFTVLPDEVYNLAGQSNVSVSFKEPVITSQVNAFAVLTMLELLRALLPHKSIKFFQASSSHIFGLAGTEHIVDENSPLSAQSPYAITKLYSHLMTQLYRQAYGLFADNGILFNHESERRSADFVSQKIVEHAAAYRFGKKQVLKLGNLDVCRDWGYAPDYVHAMWLMLQQEGPDDYVIASGHSHLVREFVERAYAYVNVHLTWSGSNYDEVGSDKETNEVVVAVDADFFRPSESPCLVGNASKAKRVLGWEAKTNFTQLVAVMMDAELARYVLVQEDGFASEPMLARNSTLL